MIRGAHLSPDTASVDVYLTAFSGGTTALWLSSVGYADVSPYNRIAPGLYAVSMRPHGAAKSTPAALSWTFTAKPGAAYTAAAVGMNAHLRGIVLQDQLVPPSPGHGLVRIIQAASRAPHADIAAQGGPTLAKSVAFASTTNYAPIAAGSWDVDATSDSAPTVATSAKVAIPSGSVSSIVLLDAKSGGITIRSLADAVGASSAPIGAVPAGGGGTAARPHSSSARWGTAAALAALVALSLAIGGRAYAGRRRRGRPVVR